MYRLKSVSVKKAKRTPSPGPGHLMQIASGARKEQQAKAGHAPRKDARGESRANSAAVLRPA